MHLKRLAVAAVLVPLFYLYVMYLPPVCFLLLLAFFSTLGLVEFYAISGVNGALRYAGLFCGAALLTVFFLSRASFPDALLFSVLLVLSARLFARRDPLSSRFEASAALAGILYVPGLLSFQISLFRGNPVWIVLLYATVWASDSMAYYVGKGIGRRKLYPEVSPNKTVEGAVGSVAGGILGALLIRGLLVHQLPLFQAALLGAAVGIATIVGDLVESMFKRDAGVKDSSSIIPGHGGVLDKIDGVTFAGPVFYWVCTGLGLLS